ncbi:radical SAM protein [Candidatus Peregrinibacteria bacterium CG10_big_fil_rev_8_21_14_0_10_49_10]|nr:MAG: radical SAM protein [Candidatus Peregrinibacteria bacterium CG10_big_fil_rev_8_21_14_0_10_49_10]
MNVIKEFGSDSLAKVYVAEINGHTIEFVESIQPPHTREEKWVLVLSCLIGCPVQCLMCDAGQECHGVLTEQQIFDQIDYMVMRRYPTGTIPCKKFKVQFTRMGEPVFCPAILDVLEELPHHYHAPGLIPSVSTVGPKNDHGFLRRLTEIKKRLYGSGMFQMQFSVHTTDKKMRDKLIPIRKMDLDDIAAFGERFYEEGDRKITLNFIVMEEYPIEPTVLAQHFDPAKFIIKLTPLNPTGMAETNHLQTKLDPYDGQSVQALVEDLARHGFESLVSIGALEENQIGSNCGQYVSTLKRQGRIHLVP